MRFIILTVAATAALSLTGCPNPNAIGVQVYGTIAATCVLASNGQPVSGCLVIVNSTQYCTTPASGMCSVPMVPVGPQQVRAEAPGLTSNGSTPVSVTENQTSSVTLQMIPSQ